MDKYTQKLDSNKRSNFSSLKLKKNYTLSILYLFQALEIEIAAASFLIAFSNQSERTAKKAGFIWLPGVSTIFHIFYTFLYEVASEFLSLLCTL